MQGKTLPCAERERWSGVTTRQDVRPFLVLGAMKSGTTTFETILRSHPDIAITSVKEADSFFDQGLAESAARRISMSGALVAGEVSTAYMQYPVREQPVDVVRRTLGPDVCLLAILRDPFERAVSHWRHWYQLGRESEPVDVICADVDGPYKTFSSYHLQLQPWISMFGADRIHCLRLEDYQHDPVGTTGRLWEFLGIPSAPASPAVQKNVGADRVAARGWRRRVSSSVVYRRGIRPMLSPKVRRAGLVALGGTSRRTGVPEDARRLREPFMSALASDRHALAEAFPHLTWPDLPTAGRD